MRTNPWMEVSGLCLKRQGREVLDSITFAAHGRALGVVGENGAGKTSLIGCLLGLLRPHTGLIQALDFQLPEQHLELKTRTGVMLEDAGVFPGGSGLDTVVFAGLLCGMTRNEAVRRAHLVLDNLDVDEERFRETRTYSVGMRQRVKLAMSLVHEPSLLILDEPTIGLDHQGRRQFLRLIRKLRDQGVRLFFTTHILSDAEQICDELLLLSDGRVSHFGAVDSMVETSDKHYIAHLNGGSSRLAGALVDAGFGVKKVEENTVVFQVENRDAFHEFWKCVQKSEVEIRQLGPAIRSLETAVVEAMENQYG